MRRLSQVLSALLLITMALAGCAGSEDTTPQVSDTSNPDSDDMEIGGDVEETEDPDTSDDPDQDPEDNGTEEEEAPENQPPTASLSADNLTGEAPMDVTFTIEGSDEDGDDLGWSLDVDGDQEPDAEGDELPAEYTHTYESGFSGNASLVVSDGADEAVASVELDIADAPVAETFSWECTVQIPAVVVGLSGGPVTYGSCPLGTLDAAAVFDEQEAPSGCSVRTVEEGATSNDVNLVPAEPGTEYPAGTEFAARCDAPDGALPESTITAHYTYVA